MSKWVNVQVGKCPALHTMYIMYIANKGGLHIFVFP